MYNTNIINITLPGKEGPFTITSNHNYVVATLSSGEIRYISEDGEEAKIYIKGGFVELKNRVISICIDD
jgi:F0F1-type ATP synthase, epsilon subunit (mitochondrial delta subunit)